MELTWTRRRVGALGRVVAISRPRSGRTWALYRTPGLLGGGTAVHRRSGGEWEQVFRLNGSLRSIAELCDGSLLAVGERQSVLVDEQGRRRTMGGLEECSRVWGVDPGRTNALAGGRLFRLERERWVHVDLEALGIQGSWADGDCDSAGRGWIVGCNGTHSCLAAGVGASWEENGCGSWYLYLVHVPEGGTPLVAGGDGAWSYDGASWKELDCRRDFRRLPLPLALSARGSVPIVVAISLQDRGSKSLAVWTDSGGFRGIFMPFAARSANLVIDGEARLLAARRASLWESSPLTTPFSLDSRGRPGWPV